MRSLAIFMFMACCAQNAQGASKPSEIGLSRTFTTSGESDEGLKSEETRFFHEKQIHKNFAVGSDLMLTTSTFTLSPIVTPALRSQALVRLSERKVGVFATAFSGKDTKVFASIGAQFGSQSTSIEDKILPNGEDLPLKMSQESREGFHAVVSGNIRAGIKHTLGNDGVLGLFVNVITPDSTKGLNDFEARVDDEKKKNYAQAKKHFHRPKVAFGMSAGIRF